jgi:hypothetical protein
MLNQLYETLLNVTGFSIDRELFFKWLRKVLTQKNFWIEPAYVKDFFHDKI